MQYLDQAITQRKHRPNHNAHHRTRSHDPTPQPLTPKEVKILLAQAPAIPDYAAASRRQQLLQQKQLFDPRNYFGATLFPSVAEAQRYHQPRIENMLLKTAYRNSVKTIPLRSSSGSKVKRGGVQRSPSKCVKENKQNYQKLNLGNVGKLRVKLKLQRKQAAP